MGAEAGRRISDGIVRALCGCYVFEMSDLAVGRLLSSVLAAGDGEAGEEGSWRREGRGPVSPR